jgi:hypothetical protein
LTIDAPGSGSTVFQLYNLPVFGNEEFTLGPTSGCKPIEVSFVPVEFRVVGVGTGSGRIVSGSGAIDCAISGGKAASTGCASTRTLGTRFSLVATPASGSVFNGYKDVCPGVGAGAVCSVITAGSVTTLTVDFSTTIDPTAAASIAFSSTSLTVDVGGTAQVTATVKNGLGNVLTDKVVSWFTSDGSIAGGTANGNTAIVQGVKAGSAIVTASIDSVTASLPVTVRATAPKPVATVVISPGVVVLGVGTIVPLVATLRDAQGNVITDRSISWITSNAAVANGAVSGNLALVQGLAVGAATISATSEGITGSALITVTGSTPTFIPLTCAGLAGGQVYAADGQYLGRLTNSFDSQSILNAFGSFGSHFSSTSMYNAFSLYGSQFGSLSAYNSFASTPPQLYVSGQFAAYVTKNTAKIPRVDPDALHGCAFP